MSFLQTASKSLRPVANLFNKVSIGAGKLFNKGMIGGNHLFGKGSIGSKFLGSIKSGLNSAGNVIGHVGREIADVVNNPLTQSFASAVPYGASLLSGAGRLANLASGLSHTAHLGSDLANQKGYRGSTGNVVGNILEKSRGVAQNVNRLNYGE